MRVRNLFTILLLPLLMAGSAFAQGVAPESAEKYNEGQELFKKRRFRDALAQFESAIELDGKNAQAYRAIGKTQQKLRAYDQAEDAFKMATSVKPDYVESYFELGQLQLQRKKFKDAQASLKKVLEINVGFADGKAKDMLKAAYVREGINLLRRRNAKGAVVQFRSATQIDPSDAGTFYNLGLAQKGARNYNAAEGAFSTAVDLDPNHAKAHRALGDLYKLTRKNSRARNSYLNAIKADPKDTRSRLSLAIVYQDLNQNSRAISVLAKAATVDPKNAKVHIALGVAYANGKQFTKALGAYQKALNIKSSAEVRYRMAVAYFETKQHQKAINSARKAVSSSKFRVPAHVIMGDSYRDLGNKDKAIEHYKKGVGDRRYKKFCEDQIDRILNPMGSEEDQ